MSFRKLLIRIMLAALGITAIAGVFAVLSGGRDIGGRVVGTGILAAVTAGLMLPFTFLAEKEKTRREGLLGMGLIILEFCAGLGLIWQIFGVGGIGFEEHVGLTMFFAAITGLPAILFLRFSSMKTPRVAGFAGIALCAIVFVLLMIATWKDGPDDQWYETAGAVSALGILIVASLPGNQIWRWAGVIAATVSLFMAVFGVWSEVHHQSAIFLIIVSVAAIIAHANLCMLVPLSGGQKWIRIVTILAVIATASLYDTLIIGDEYQADVSFVENLAAAAGIVASCGSLALLVLARINRNFDRVPVMSEIREMTVFCPSCSRKQVLPIGDSACQTCGLKITIAVQEPRCPKCDYVLLMLQSDRCPECGTVVRGEGASLATGTI